MASQPPNPELAAHLEKRICVKLNENRIVYGKLMGFDSFMNLNLVDVQIQAPGKPPVKAQSCVIRGACILSFEAINNQ